MEELKVLEGVIPSNIKKICYCCQENPSSILLWIRNGDNETYGKMLQNCFCIEVDSNNSDVICVDCVAQLQSSVKFKQQVTCAKNDQQMFIPLKQDSPDQEFSTRIIKIEEVEVEVKKEPPETECIVNPDDFIKLENEKYQCRKCEKVLDDYVNTLQHMNKVHYENTSHKCEECDEQFVSQNNLDKHRLEVHTESRPGKSLKAKKVAKSKVPSKTIVKKTYTCNECSQKLVGKKNFLQHELYHREEAIKKLEKIKQDYENEPPAKPQTKPLQPEDYTKVDKNCFLCKHCNKTFKYMSSLLRHVNSKHRLIPTSFCDLCDEKFPTSIRLVMHKLNAHNIDLRCACNACSRVFWDKKTLISHQNSFHKLGNPKKCPYCEYTTYYTLRDHMSKHTKEIRFSCPHCPKEFSRQDSYKYHVRIHTGDKRKVCKICGERFIQRASLIYHVKKHHPNDIEEAKGNIPSELVETQMVIGD